MKKVFKLYFIRHASVEKKKGFFPENDPNAIFEEKEIKEISKKLPKNSICYVSPLKRTFQTALAISKYVKFKKIIFDEDIKEQNFGDWSGKKISEVWSELKKNKTHHNYSFICPEIIPPKGENFIAQCNRIAVWVEKITSSNCSSIIVITHSGTIKAALSHMLGIEPDKVLGIEISHLSLNIFEVLSKEDDKDRGGRFRLLSLNNL